jgi:cellulose synthase (UDP-forming)
VAASALFALHGGSGRRPLLLISVLLAIWSIVSIAVGLRRRRVSRKSHDRLVAIWSLDVYPTVDVFLPSCGEDLPILANAYSAVAGLKYPGQVTVYVLDDSARSEVRELAGTYGFEYRSRPDRGRLKKAGNLLYGYGLSSSDYIAIFDADFAPRPDFLVELLPYFDDTTGIVQSPQYFPCTAEQNWLERSAGATQDFFYCWVQQARDTVGAAICVGTNAIYSRRALDEAGGFAQIGHSEDVHTGVALLRAGYRLRYVPVILAKGLCPETFSGFMSQQYRWCAGSMSLLSSRAFHRMPLTFLQRTCFWSGFLYYIMTALLALIGTIPATVMALFYPAQVHPRNYLLIAASMCLTQMLLPIVTFRRGRRFEMLRISTLYSFAHAVAILDVLRGRTASWTPTGASSRRAPLPTRITRFMRVWLATAQLTMWGAMLWRVFECGIHDYWPMVCLAVMTLITTWPLLLATTKDLGLRRRLTRRFSLTQEPNYA